MWWITLLNRLLLGAGGLAGIGLGLLYGLQEKLLYVPIIPGEAKGYEFSPDQYKINFEDLYIEAQDGVKLHAWVLWSQSWTLEERKSKPSILFFQANAGNISHRLELFKRMIANLDCVVIALSYRGYGLSEGSPTEAGLKLDSEAILEAIETSPTINSEKLVVFGRSLGGAVAIHLTARHQDKVKGLVVENTFTSIEDMASQVFPLLRPLIGKGKVANFLVRNKWYNHKEIKKITSMPILLYSSERDEIVPREQMVELREACTSSDTKFVSMEAYHMNGYVECPHQYWTALRSFTGKIWDQ